MQPQVTNHSGFRRGLTLVELLVVVGIISVLIAILLPVLSSAREHANRVKCAANLRSIGQALTMYVQQYRYYPSGQFLGPSPANNAAVWAPRLRPFLPGSKDIFLCPSRDDSFRWSDSGPDPVIPATGLYVDVGYVPGEPMVHGKSHFSYGYNCLGYGDSSSLSSQKGLGTWPSIAGDPLNTPGNRMFGELPLSKVRKAAEMVAVADSNGDGVLDYAIRPNADSSYMWPGGVHNGGANVLFCDGHVMWYARDDLVVTHEPPTAADVPLIRMWNHDNNSPDFR